MLDNLKSADNVLIKEAKLGNKRAFDLLALKYQNKLIKLVSRYVRDPSDIWDITQESFLKAYCALSKFREESAFYTWLYRIAINTAKNYNLFISRRPPDTDVDFADAEQLTQHGLYEIATPEHCLLRDELQEALINALNKLPAELRLAIILRELEGYSYGEIATQMHCPIGTVRSRIFRARVAIEQRLHSFL